MNIHRDGYAFCSGKGRWRGGKGKVASGSLSHLAWVYCCHQPPAAFQRLIIVIGPDMLLWKKRRKGAPPQEYRIVEQMTSS